MALSANRAPLLPMGYYDFRIKMVIWSMYPIFRQTQIVQEKTWGFNELKLVINWINT